MNSEKFYSESSFHCKLLIRNVNNYALKNIMIIKNLLQVNEIFQYEMKIIVFMLRGSRGNKLS